MEAVLANPESTSADYASAYTRLRNSAENLAKKPPVNKTDLNKAVEDAGKKDLSAFTAESVKAFTAALEDAKAVLGDLDATQEEVDEALKALKAAEANLEKEPAPGPGPNPNPGPNPGPNPIPGPEDPVVIPAKGTTIPVKGITYKVTKSDAKNGTVSVFKADKKLGKAVIPSSVKIGGYTFKVTSVDAKAFSGRKKITSVTIGANVTSIGSKAFENCKKLKKVTFKSTKAPKIASKAFSGTYAKCKVTAPKKMTKKEFNLLKTRLKKAKISKKAIIKK